MRVLNSRQMRDADRRTIEDVGIPSIVLMENAGRQVVAAMESTFESLAVMSVAVLCGRGNNGGDGFVVSRTLIERDVDVAVYLFAASAEVRGDARTNLDVLRNLGVDVVEITDAAAWELHGREVLGADIIVDALVGTGLNAPLAGLYETVIADVNASPRPVVAVDLPSGLSADDHAVNGPVIDASLTVTLGAPKLPLVLPPGEALAGTLVIADIGIPAGVIEDVEGSWVEILTKEAMRQLVEPRAQDSHKGDYGRVLIVAGSPGKSGAAILAGMAALRSGAGLVTIATPRSQVPLVAAGSPECMTLALPEDDDGFVRPDAIDLIVEFNADVIAIGPGLGRTAGVRTLVHAATERIGVPLILDADAIVSFAGEPDRLMGRDGVDLIITPHPGEMAALIGLSTADVQAHRLAVARDFAATHRLNIVLKGHRTIVATPEGRSFINLTGNAGMATAGAGDVLTGAVAAWAGQLLDAEAACKLAVYLHGLAGDLAESDEGEVGMIASDILARLGEAVQELTARRKKTQTSS
jgi:ADP-dependent NAD(P)H-hydrate dehydratase / NAD(P)H-hydrate epimerase